MEANKIISYFNKDRLTRRSVTNEGLVGLPHELCFICQNRQTEGQAKKAQTRRKSSFGRRLVFLFAL